MEPIVAILVCNFALSFVYLIVLSIRVRRFLRKYSHLENVPDFVTGSSSAAMLYLINYKTDEISEPRFDAGITSFRRNYYLTFAFGWFSLFAAIVFS